MQRRIGEVYDTYFTLPGVLRQLIRRMKTMRPMEQRQGRRLMRWHALSRTQGVNASCGNGHAQVLSHRRIAVRCGWAPLRLRRLVLGAAAEFGYEVVLATHRSFGHAGFLPPSSQILRLYAKRLYDDPCLMPCGEVGGEGVRGGRTGSIAVAAGDMRPGGGNGSPSMPRRRDRSSSKCRPPAATRFFSRPRLKRRSIRWRRLRAGARSLPPSMFTCCSTSIRWRAGRLITLAKQFVAGITPARLTSLDGRVRRTPALLRDDGRVDRSVRGDSSGACRDAWLSA